MSTDYDCWKEDEEAVNVEMVIENLHANAENAKKLLKAVVLDVYNLANPYKNSIHSSIITAPEKRNSDQIKKLKYLFPDL
jgi:5'-methylthioadenosine phosphorylase